MKKKKIQYEPSLQRNRMAFVMSMITLFHGLGNNEVKNKRDLTDNSFSSKISKIGNDSTYFSPASWQNNHYIEKTNSVMKLILAAEMVT